MRERRARGHGLARRGRPGSLESRGLARDASTAPSEWRSLAARSGRTSRLRPRARRWPRDSPPPPVRRRRGDRSRRYSSMAVSMRWAYARARSCSMQSLELGVTIDPRRGGNVFHHDVARALSPGMTRRVLVGTLFSAATPRCARQCSARALRRGRKTRRKPGTASHRRQRPERWPSRARQRRERTAPGEQATRGAAGAARRIVRFRGWALASVDDLHEVADVFHDFETARLELLFCPVRQGARRPQLEVTVEAEGAVVRLEPVTELVRRSPVRGPSPTGLRESVFRKPAARVAPSATTPRRFPKPTPPIPHCLPRGTFSAPTFTCRSSSAGRRSDA